MNKYKLIFFDIDGTIYSHKKNEIPKSTIKSIKTLREKGYKIALCSGRSLYLLNQLNILDFIDVDYFVLINGTLVIDNNNNVIYKHPINNSIIEKLVLLTRKINGEIGMITSDDLFRLDEQNSLITRGYMPLNISTPPMKEYQNKEIYQCNLFINDKDLFAFNELMIDLDFIPLLEYGYDVITKGESKEKGIEKLLNFLNISNEECIAFGDGNNDLGMIKYVGLGIAMGNGVTKLKEVADYVTTSIDDDGIYNALKKLKII